MASRAVARTALLAVVVLDDRLDVLKRTADRTGMSVAAARRLDWLAVQGAAGASAADDDFVLGLEERFGCVDGRLPLPWSELSFPFISHPHLGRCLVRGDLHRVGLLALRADGYRTDAEERFDLLDVRALIAPHPPLPDLQALPGVVLRSNPLGHAPHQLGHVVQVHAAAVDQVGHQDAQERPAGLDARRVLQLGQALVGRWDAAIGDIGQLESTH